MLRTDGSGKICILPEAVIGRIAAGEVVERPAAVVKELLENSLDAGSRSITIDVREGGLTSIRVSDDGEGMCPEDAPRAFQRHATSKLRSDLDLWSIRTMGFRGEALPSIAAVAHVRLMTATRSAEVGTELEVVEGEVERIAEGPPITGTRIEVAELFHNQPARKKFLKSTLTEFLHISRVVQQASLAWPSVHFRLTHNSEEIFNYPSAPSDDDRIAQVYRRTFIDQSLRIRVSLPGARVSGYIVDAVHAKSSRVPQELFVNRRPVRSATVSHAVGEGYGSFLAKGSQPRFVLFLEIDPDRLDVNVHPTKREVRFSDNEVIHQLVRRAVCQALSGGKLADPGKTPFVESSMRRTLSSIVAGLPTSESVETESTTLQVTPGTQLPLVSDAAEPYAQVPSTEVIALGQINRTFLIAQVEGDLTVIDQHTAHERVLFERLHRAWTTSGIQAQPLLIPDPVELSPPQTVLLQRYQRHLEELGVEIEPFGSSTVLVRAIPVGLGKIEPTTFLQDLIDDLTQWDSAPGLEARVRSVLASLACHGAVRAGRSMKPDEIKALVEDWRTEGEITTCPHGRRTSFRLGITDLEKMFGRAGW
ncbi:MAG: DNA mismatch repair protein MutL [Nitrospira sp. LK265]|nr:DNA mismatch repair endonuclease MutL [Nitrospira sp.]NGZ58991.1 DNA mismatch repair protein MutL [Nitrospira sp. LK265]